MTTKTSEAQALAQARFTKRSTISPRSFLSLAELPPEDCAELVALTLEIKRTPRSYASALAGICVALLFQKTSTRTRCSFETGVYEMGGYSSYIDWQTSNFVRADVEDEIKVLSRYYDLIVARVVDHATLVAMARNAEAPIINGLCNRYHPCQALSDFATISEYFGPSLDGLRIAYLGDGNNVCRSLVHAAARFGAHMTLCTPRRYALDGETIRAAEDAVRYMEDPMEAVHDADVIYTDTWVSMGNERETEQRVGAFGPYQINQCLLAAAPAHALVMHCLPAHPGQEITPEILRGSRSIVFDQAENRKHTQKALMQWLLGSAGASGSA